MEKYIDFGIGLERIAWIEFDGVKYINTTCCGTGELIYSSLQDMAKTHVSPANVTQI